MIKKVVKLSAILIALLCMTALSVSANSHKTKWQSRRAVSDGLIYAQVFYLIDGFERGAEKMSDEQAKEHFKNYFAREANLTDEQQQFLKTVALNFTSAANLISYKEKLKLSTHYKNELKIFFGASDFDRFDKFVRSKIAPGVVACDPSNACQGVSGISLNENLHILYGYSSTVIYTRNSVPTTVCSVSATMSGPNVSASGSSSDCTNTNPSVELMSATYLPNSQYCVNGSHTYNPPQFNSGYNVPSSSSSACLITPAVSKVIHVNFERIVTDDAPIDTNPNAGSGLRIYPDKKTPTDMENRRKIRVRAKIGANTAGVRVYFRSFDFDDPSASGAPIDPETTQNAGNDNKGNVDGTTNTRAGQFSSSLSQYDCQVSANSADCFTDSYGEAVVDFTLTMQPGDNFAVAAGTNDSYLNGLVLAADGINLKDTANIQTPATTTNNIIACYNSSANACRTDMLTVWRRLHLEVDSMGTVTNNKVTDIFPVAQTLITPVTTLQLNVNTNLDPDRFENGLLVIGGRSFEIYANTANTVSVSVGRPYAVTAGQSFTIYDDDDFDSSSSAFNPKNGDNGEDIPLLNQDFLKDNDTFPTSINTPNSNTLAPAYIRPKYDLSGSGDEVPFLANISANTGQAIRNAFLFDNYLLNMRTDFWTVYLLSGYQYTSIADGDPTTESTSGNRIAGISDSQQGQGSIVFWEAHAPHECYTADPIECSVYATKIHEIGHLLNANHGQGRVMDDVSINFSNISLNEIRENIRP